jgi:hypothetical protein
LKVCGFSFVRNGIKFGYPFQEAIQSILPICDQVIVAVGNSDDNTLEKVKAIDPKVKVIKTTWDESLRKGGRVLAVETDKAFQAIPQEYDWAFYLQGDEVVHEKHLPVILKAMADNLNQADIDGLLFKYVHFFGSYDFVGVDSSWYRREIRVVRNKKDIFSYRDAQGFRKKNNKKLNVKLIDAEIMHYGYAKQPEVLQKKVNTIKMFFNKNVQQGNNGTDTEKFEYEGMNVPVRKFSGTHPRVMQELISRKNWSFNPDLSIKYYSLKDRVKKTIFKYTGWIPGEYKNYKIIR